MTKKKHNFSIGGLRRNNFIHINYLGDCRIMKVDGDVHVLDFEKREYRVKKESLQPIKITTDWLKKFGFEVYEYSHEEILDGYTEGCNIYTYEIRDYSCHKGQDVYFYVQMFCYVGLNGTLMREKVNTIFYCIGGDLYFEEFDETGFISEDCIHDLQNFFFDIMGFDLEIGRNS
ncbi:hypothetical protein [Salinimicrobium sediminilitoris]|uniref:hypothetical protein n=1 Tax=Salinimicrobium sediminilitoris TaxID=2876715 RepID=UPI001E536980|nr:hypothetical protein [Salinimicrobium sediminilitoris]MCC8360267.1 hypothetical protein [Salinimicrobium sediminilitoris]